MCRDSHAGKKSLVDDLRKVSEGVGVAGQEQLFSHSLD